MTASDAGQATPSPSRGCVFLVDDEDADRELFARTLQQAGVPVACRAFACGDQMLDALLEVLRGAPPPIACFVDVKMAGMSGLDVLRWIRAQSSLHSVPVIMLSSSDAPEHMSEAMQFGAQCYVTKFPTPEQVREILAAAWQHAAAASCEFAFPVSCNLFAGHHQAA